MHAEERVVCAARVVVAAELAGEPASRPRLAGPPPPGHRPTAALPGSGPPVPYVGTVRATACLIDLYETALRCDWRAHQAEMPGLAGLPPQVWNEGFLAYGPHVTDGRLTIAEAYAGVFVGAGMPVDDSLVQRLVARDRELLVETAASPTTRGRSSRRCASAASRPRW